MKARVTPSTKGNDAIASGMRGRKLPFVTMETGARNADGMKRGATFIIANTRPTAVYIP
jgi:hypothetical protein